MAKNAKGEKAENGPQHKFAVNRYKLRRGPAARQMRAQGGQNELELSFLKLVADHQDLCGAKSPFNIEITKIAERQGKGGHPVRQPRTATEQLLVLDTRPGCARRERTKLNKLVAAA